MATFSHALVCAALALLIWGSIGFAIGRRVLPQSLTLPFAPLLGWAAHSVIALPLFCFVGMTRSAVVTITSLSVLAAFVSCFRPLHRSDTSSSDPVGVPMLAVVGALFLSCAVMLCLIPNVTSDGAALAAPIFDHSKSAIVDDIARLGVPAGNPFIGEERGLSRLSYYYLWHFAAAELSILTGLTGWEADAGMTFFTAFSSLALMMGLAVWTASRASAAFWVLAIAATSSIREVLSWILGWEIIGTMTGWPSGFGGWLFQVTWAPQHVASAACSVIAILFLTWIARRPSWPLTVGLALLSAAAFESSTWVGGITYPLAVVVIVPVALVSVDPKLRWRFIILTAIAAASAVALSSLFVHDQLLASALRGDSVPLSLLPYEVLGDEIPKAARRFLDLPAYWTTFLFVEFAAFYPFGLFFAAALSNDAPPSDRPAIVSLGALAVVGLGVGGSLVSTVGGNNDLGWRGVLPAILVLIAFTSAGLGRYLRVMKPFYAMIILVAVASGLFSGVRDIYANLNVKAQGSAKQFLHSLQMWTAIQRNSAVDERVANNPSYLSDMTTWPINISWALLANRRSCYAGADLALPFAPIDQQRRMEIDNIFAGLFSGKASHNDVDQIATEFNCSLVVITPDDGAWTSGIFASPSSYQLVDSVPQAWRLYRIRSQPTK